MVGRLASSTAKAGTYGVEGLLCKCNLSIGNLATDLSVRVTREEVADPLNGRSSWNHL